MAATDESLVGSKLLLSHLSSSSTTTLPQFMDQVDKLMNSDNMQDTKPTVPTVSISKVRLSHSQLQMKKAASACSSTTKEVTSRNSTSIECSKAIADGSEILKQAKNKYYLKREHLNLATAPKVVVADEKHVNSPHEAGKKSDTDVKKEESSIS